MQPASAFSFRIWDHEQDCRPGPTNDFPPRRIGEAYAAAIAGDRFMSKQWLHPLRHYLQVAAFCCVIALVLNTIWPGDGFLLQLGYALSVGTISWAVIEFGRHLFNQPGYTGWPRGWRGLALTGLGIVAGYYFGMMAADALFGNVVEQPRRDNTISWIITLIAGVGISYFFHARGKQAELAARISAAECDAAEARLKLIATQLEPHMLFNTLANLRVLIATDPQRAVAMLDLLNSYLRVTLTGSRALSHPLAAEFDRLRDYLELMSVRMGARLRYTLDLPGELRAVPVPPLLLQPLLENSIHHGLEPQVEGGEITVRARRDGARLIVEVLDTGVGIEAGTNDGTHSESGGFGLAHVRERLANVYAGESAMTLTALPTGGTCATITFPMPA
jgi:Histidine kinase/Histidine kinase-, DNA gyrase B-, and HSP90-like ATPase